MQPPLQPSRPETRGMSIDSRFSEYGNHPKSSTMGFVGGRSLKEIVVIWLDTGECWRLGCYRGSCRMLLMGDGTI